MKITKRIAKEVHNEKVKSYDEGFKAGQISIHNMSRKACYEAGKQSAEENSQTYVKGYKDGKQEAELKCNNCKTILKAQLVGMKEAKKETLKSVLEIIEKQIKETPYPKDVFIEPTKEQWRKVAELFENNNFVQDKYFGSEARRVWRLSLEELKLAMEKLD